MRAHKLLPVIILASVGVHQLIARTMRYAWNLITVPYRGSYPNMAGYESSST